MAKKKRKTLTPVFMAIWSLLAEGQPEPEFEYRFVAKSDDPRALQYRAPKGGPAQWRFDVYWLAYRLAVELEGGTHGWQHKCHICGTMATRPNRWSGKRDKVIAVAAGHAIGEGYRKNCIKYNAAADLGWRVFRYTSTDLRTRPQEIIDQITGLLSEGKLVNVPEQGKMF